MEVSGVRLEPKVPDFIKSHERIRPLRDRLVVKPEAWKPSSTIHVVDRIRRTLRARIVACGPGTYPWIYNKDRSKRWPSKHFIPTQVKEGQIVELGGLEIDGYQFPEIMIGTERHLLVQEQDICGVVEE